MVAGDSRFPRATPSGLPLAARCVPDLCAVSTPSTSPSSRMPPLTITTKSDAGVKSNKRTFESFDVSLPQSHSKNVLKSCDIDRMLGSRKWITAWGGSFGIGLIIGIVFLYFRMKHLTYVELVKAVATFIIMYFSTCFTTLAFIVPLWQEVREHVPMGMLASTFWVSGTVSVLISFTVNSVLMVCWEWLSPECCPLSPDTILDESRVSSYSCLGLVLVEWILTPGLVEEVAKSIALLRLKPTTTSAEAAISRLTSSFKVVKPSVAVSFYKLALTPAAMTLAGLAAGGGFATVENFWFIFFRDPPEAWLAVQSADPARALARLLPLHQLFSGIVAADLALWHWLPVSDCRRPRYKWRGLLYVIPLHGLFDGCTYTTVFIQAATFRPSHLTSLVYALTFGKFAVVFFTIYLFFQRWGQVCTWFHIAPRPHPITVI